LKNIRLIARMDIKGENLIKGIHLEGLRIIGNPNDYAIDYYQQGIDEIIYMDSVASLYGRNHLSDLIRDAVKNIFVPITVGGGIRSVEDASNILRAGADKIAINTAAVRHPTLISALANNFGAQCVVISIEAKKCGTDLWEVYVDNGREKTGINVLDWVKKVEQLGAGELLITSVDNEGTRKGFDISLYDKVSSITNLPLIASGGMGSLNDFVDVVKLGRVDAVAIADIIHYKRTRISEIKSFANQNKINIRL
jgi:cyclase